MDELFTQDPAQEIPPSDTPTPEGEALNDGIELEVDPGKRLKFTSQQLVDFYKNGLRQQDYTRKTQELAQMRKQYEEVGPAYQKLMEERQQVVEFLRNPQLVAQYLSETFGSKPDLTKPATLADAQEAAEQRAARLEQELGQLRQQLGQQFGQFDTQVQQRISDEIEGAHYKQELNAHLGKIFEDNPVLADIDHMEDVIRWKVYQMQPKDLAAAKEAFTKVAKEQADRIGRRFVQSTEPAETPPTRKKPAIEPRGGKTPIPKPAEKKSYMKRDGDIDWNAVAKDALITMEGRG